MLSVGRRFPFLLFAVLLFSVMIDLPEGILRQQGKAHAIEAHELERLGKCAANKWSEGTCETLTDAVCAVVKTAATSLSPEQVRRVVEYTNVSAYLSEFRKESAHKIVDFGRGGPASFSDVIKELNGGAAVQESEMSDYAMPPKRKEASDADFLVARAFRVKEASAGFPEENPYEEVLTLHAKIAESRREIADYVRSLELQLDNSCRALYSCVKEAAREGVSLGQVVQAWGAVCDDPIFVKAAFDAFVPKFYQDGVFTSLGEVGESLAKTASAACVNVNHPIVTNYEEFCTKLAELAGAQQMLEEYTDAASFGDELVRLVAIKEANASGLLPTLKKTQKAIASGAEKYLGTSDVTNTALSHGLAYGVPALAAYGVGKTVSDAADDYGVTKYVPGTKMYDFNRMQRQGGGY